ncbi:hypothetical protein [Sulfurimonas sp.]|uniref:hypothetical protein n=1 Tax=Sulfurimonas sp. TaxID=2022749 RepID=UPI0025E1F5AD|nr:hypothetical protein [Sulfurimonas sp.]
MHIKRYTIASLILIALVGWYVFAYVSQDTTAIEVFGVSLPAFPVAVWVIVPLVVLYITSVIHMSFYSMLAGFNLRKYNKDFEKVIDAIADAYMSKDERNHIYKTPRYQLLGSIIDNTTLFPSASLSDGTQNEKLDAVLKVIEDIKNGEVVELKKYSLKPENALVIQNDRNRYKKGDITAENILSRADTYAPSLVQEAYSDLVKTASLTKIEQYKSFLTKESLFDILSRINASESSLDISNEALINIFNILDLDTKDLIKISSSLSVSMIPDQRIKLFETLSETREDAIEAYMFTLFDLEMIAPANELLENTQDNEYLNFKAYSALKECGKNFNINLFI